MSGSPWNGGREGWLSRWSTGGRRRWLQSRRLGWPSRGDLGGGGGLGFKRSEEFELEALSPGVRIVLFNLSISVQVVWSSDGSLGNVATAGERVVLVQADTTVNVRVGV
jgi:hypothetical protein